jgi:hypothetical protein
MSLYTVTFTLNNSRILSAGDDFAKPRKISATTIRRERSREKESEKVKKEKEEDGDRRRHSRDIL